VFSTIQTVTSGGALKKGLYRKKHIWTNHKQETHGQIFFRILLTKSNSKKKKRFLGINF